jgi:RHS repeat-associated protein
MLGGVHGCTTTTSPGRRQLIPNSPLGAQRSARQLRRQLRFRKLRSAPRLRAGLVKNRVRFDYTYLYDDDGDRVEETVNGTATYYLIDTNNPTGYDQPIEQKGSPTASPSMTYILGDRVLGQASYNGSTVTMTYLLADGHGSTRLLTNASGTVTATLNYDAFGNALNFNPATIGTIWQFGGDGYYDYASGLTFHSNGRPSSSILGRFIMMDDQGYGDNSDPITLNAEIYGDGDPVNNRDPSGHDALSDYAFGLASEYAGENLLGLQTVGASTGESAIDMEASLGASVGDLASAVGGAMSSWLDSPNPTGILQGAAQGAWAGLVNDLDALTFHQINSLNNYRNTLWNNQGLNNSWLGTIANGAAWVGTACGYAALATFAWGAAGGGTMDISVNLSTGEPFLIHVQYGVGGVFEEATGTSIGQMYVLTARQVVGTVVKGIPVLYPQSVLLGGSGLASSCVSAAVSAFLRGWGIL